MQVRELMTSSPVFATRQTSLEEVAKAMRDSDVGALPVVNDQKKPVGIITDRDITMRILARGENPLDFDAKAAMTDAVVTIRDGAGVEDAVQLMEDEKVRRLIVVDNNGIVLGILSQADIARELSQHVSGDVLKEVSQPEEQASGPSSS